MKRIFTWSTLTGRSKSLPVFFFSEKMRALRRGCGSFEARPSAVLGTKRNAGSAATWEPFSAFHALAPPLFWAGVLFFAPVPVPFDGLFFG